MCTLLSLLMLLMLLIVDVVANDGTSVPPTVQAEELRPVETFPQSAQATGFWMLSMRG